MKLFGNNFTKTFFTLFLSFAVLTTACNNPAGDDDEEHPHAEGAVLKTVNEENNEEVIVRIEEGQIQFGEIEVDSGNQTAHINIYFLDEDGNEFQPDEPDFELRWDQIDTSVAEIFRADRDGTWGFHVAGIDQGQTTVRFRLWHLGEEHAEFETPAIPIIVN